MINKRENNLKFLSKSVFINLLKLKKCSPFFFTVAIFIVKNGKDEKATS